MGNQLQPASRHPGLDGPEHGEAREDVYLAGDLVEARLGGRGVGNDALDGDDVGVDHGRQYGGDGLLDVTHLVGPSVEDLECIGVVGVEGLADQADQFAAADSAGIVLKSDDVSHDESEEVGLGRGRRGRRRGRIFLLQVVVVVVLLLLFFFFFVFDW